MRPAFVAVYTQKDVLQHRGCIYGLIDPRRPTVVRYVGQTIGHPIARLEEHMGTARRPPRRAETWTPCHLWIRSLVECGSTPSIAVLEVLPVGLLRDAEQRWIALYRKLGGADLNVQVRLEVIMGRPIIPTVGS